MKKKIVTLSVAGLMVVGGILSTTEFSIAESSTPPLEIIDISPDDGGTVNPEPELPEEEKPEEKPEEDTQKPEQEPEVDEGDKEDSEEDKDDNKPSEKPQISFSDVSNNWAREEIMELVGKGIISGYSDGTFKPNNNISREEASAMIFRYLDPSTVRTKSFPDVANDRWSAEYIGYLANRGIVRGNEQGNFNPQDNITRAEFASIVMRVIDDENLQSRYATLFNQVNEVNLTDIEGHWAENNIYRLAILQVINGYEDGTFRPNNPITRAEVSKILSMILV